MKIRTFFLSGLSTAALVFTSYLPAADATRADIESIEQLGQMLYFDANLSLNRSQSCATCHEPSFGFIDNRDNGVDSAVSLGDDGKSLGDRNAPTLSYASFSPSFHINNEGEFVGGQFLDGREVDLAEQAGKPFLNPIEMAMPDKAAVVERLKENKQYIAAFIRFYGEDIFNQPAKAYNAMTNSIAAFENSDFFSPFDSKYDRHLRGEYTMTTEEDLGMTLFFSEKSTNCTLCHQLKKSPAAEGETFTSYDYDNIGVPVNIRVRKLNGLESAIDHGLLQNPAVTDKQHDGKFKTSTLRNVAVTGPYMHNGVFRDLRTVVLFYDKYNSRSAKRQINPETGKIWAKPEVDGTLPIEELETGPALKDEEIDALVAFMKTLTDARFEHLLEP
ncbi:MAG: cytochrome c peroxidase [Gammaproteobacteria bacterium]|nr:cytochrome c peroxidase [Gammaproteobacteria bacterium]MDX2487710.1 cytochrome c peroxidase [Gammaproteobacteria bacterium]